MFTTSLQPYARVNNVLVLFERRTPIVTYKPHEPKFLTLRINHYITTARLCQAFWSCSSQHIVKVSDYHHLGT